jgi:hypothetical protein
LLASRSCTYWVLAEGEVYLVQLPRLPRRNALKVLPTDVPAEAGTKQKGHRTKRDPGGSDAEWAPIPTPDTRFETITTLVHVNALVARADWGLTRKSDGEWAGRRQPGGAGSCCAAVGLGQAAVSVMTALPSRMAMCWPVSPWSWVARSRARRCLLIWDS